MDEKCMKLSLEETCAKLCHEFDKNTDDELQGFINRAKDFLGCLHDDQIAQGAVKELLKTLLVILLVQEKEIHEMKQLMKK